MYSEFLALLWFDAYGDSVRGSSSEGALGVGPDKAASEADREPEPSLSGLWIRSSFWSWAVCAGPRY